MAALATTPPFAPAAATAGHWAVVPAALAGTNLKPLGHAAGTAPDGDTREANGNKRGHDRSLTDLR